MRLPTIRNVEESWNQMKATIHKAASPTLEVTKPGKRYINPDTWLWNDDVEMKVREKKHLYHKLSNYKTPANWQIDKYAGKQGKRSLPPERTITKIFTVNWTLRTAREMRIDLLKALTNTHVNDKNGTLLINRRAATSRWREYFQQILPEEFAHPPLPQSLPTFEAVHIISATEVEEVIK